MSESELIRPESGDKISGIVSLLRNTEDIVISGVGGRYPESDTTDEFAQNLYNNVDMITDDDRRWPKELYDMNQRMGKLKNIEHFDGRFFGILGIMAEATDPHSRLLLETAYEAICDAGINPQTIRGTNTGVYIGYSTLGMPDGMPPEIQEDSRRSLMESSIWISGTGKALYANRLSFVFDFNGPSLAIDTACSASMVAFDTAVTDLRLGKCDMAIVGGTNVNLQPYTNHIFEMAHIISNDGRSRVWDKDANGFVRGETVACLVLQRKSLAKRIYATVVHSRCNTDGYKKTGMFFPSTLGQRTLMERVYQEAGVDPNDITFFEAHGTGTKVGDPQEARAIAQALCKNRTEPLPIGLLKSNIGHGEGAAGIGALSKVIIVFENKCIPANLNLKEIKPEIAELVPPLCPVNENMPFKMGIAGINSMGVGGVNGHTLLKPNYKEITSESLQIANVMPRLVNACGRTDEGLNYIFDFIEKNPQKITRDFLALLGDVVKVNPQLNSAGFPYRGSMIIKEVIRENGDIGYEYSRQSAIMIGERKPLWFFYSGMGSQWLEMGKSLMSIDTFANSIYKSAEILKPFGIDLLNIILDKNEDAYKCITISYVGITSIQIAITDIFNKLNIIPDGIIGHSFGETGCAYADGCINHEQAILTSYWRGKVTEVHPPNGMMAAVGLSWEEAKRRAPKGVIVCCNNAPNNVTISGTYNEVKGFINTLNSENIFAREVNSNNIPYHTDHMRQFMGPLTEKIQNVIPLPQKRSEKWISSSVPESKWNDESSLYASAEYYVNNLVNPVLFYNTLKHVPADAIIVEMAPHTLFYNLINKSLENSTYIGMIQRNKNDKNLELFLSAIGKLYQNGVNPAIENLYPKVNWPVARGTQSVSSLIKWDHREPYMVKKYPEYHFPSRASDMTFSFSLINPDSEYLRDHKIEGKIIFPATGYLMLAWRRLAAARCQQWNKFPVVFENVHLRRATLFETNGTAKLTVRYMEPTGEFLVLEGGNVACYGRIYVPEDECLQMQHLLDSEEKNQINNEDVITMDTHDVYKELRVRGYDYGPKFQSIVEINYYNLQKATGKLKWNHNWITFVDSLIQIASCLIPIRDMLIPVAISSIRCDPKVLFDAIDEVKVMVDDNGKDDIEVEYRKKIPDQFAKDVREQEEAVKDGDEEFKDMNELRDVIESELSFLDETENKTDKSISILPAMFDRYTTACITKGLEIRGVLPAHLPRRPLVQGLRLENYEFISNDETEAITENVKNDIKEYIGVSCNLARKALQLMGINPENIMNHTKDAGDDIVEKMTENPKDTHVLIKIFKELNKLKFETNGNEINSQIIKEAIEKENLDQSKDFLNNVCYNERLIRPLIDIVNENNAKRELKVLEINNTNKVMAKEIEEIIASTHISPVTVQYDIAIKNPNQLEDDLKNGRFKFIEWNHSETTFPNGVSSTDLIIHRDSLDIWDLDLKSYIESAYKSLNNGGFFLALFRTKITSPELAFHYIYENKRLKDVNMTQRIEEFKKISKDIGFGIICQKSDAILYDAILFRKINKDIELNSQTIINIVNCQYDLWLETVKSKMKEHKEKKEKGNIWLIANDSPNNGILGLTLCLRQEPGGDKIRCIFDCESKLPLSIDFSKIPFRDLLINDLTVNVFRNNKFGTFRHLNLSKNCDKIMTNEAHVNVAQRGDLSSLQWFDSTNIKHPKTLKEKDGKSVELVRCNVYYSALNFRDVMLATGRIVPGPEAAFVDCIIGSEFAGRRCDTGERIYGFSYGASVATSLVTTPHLLFKVPDHWSLEEAATISNVYLCTWYGLVERALLEEGESILIHSGAGGVGQSAIMLCQYYKCNIFTTVGTEEKREFLKNTYNIPDDHIFSSRDTNFEEKVLTATKGQGVDLVLNSLVKEKLQASYRCVAMDGRFVEIGKYDLQMNSQLNMFQFLKNISFHGVTIDRVFMCGLEKSIKTLKKFSDWIDDGVKLGYVKPINTTVFSANDAEKAFRYMLKGQHIGKVLIKIRDEESDKISVNPNPVNMLSTTKTWFNPDKSYIIIGGLGGMGLELINWMILKGAKKLVLTSRSGVKTNYQRLILRRFKEIGRELNIINADIEVSTENAVTIESATKLIKFSESLGPIGGIFQLAVVLNDALIENQTIKSFQETCDPKANVTINLDKVTRERCPQLDYFVVFSSVSCGRGNGGQSNYGYANSICERICEQRRNDGIHGLAIQWGPIGDVGVMSDGDAEVMKIAGIVHQRINSCMYILDRFLQCPYPIVSSLIRAEREIIGGSEEEHMMHQLWEALGVDPNTVPNHVTLGELGMESMVAIELQQRLERVHDVSLSISDIRRITVGELKEFQTGNNDKVKRISRDIKTARESLAKVKFDIPNEPLTKLNNVQNGKPIYFLPPIEGIFSSVEEFAKLLNRPVYGVNLTRDMMEFKDMKQIALHYIKILKKFSPEEYYDIVAFSFGAVAAIKMIHKKAKINNLLIIDTFSSTAVSIDEDNDEKSFEMLFQSMNRNIPESYMKKIKEEIFKIKDENERVNKIIRDFKDFGERNINGKDVDDIIRGSFHRVKLLINFKKKMILKLKRNLSVKIAMKLNVLKKKAIIIKVTEDVDDKELIDKEIIESYGISPKTLEGKYELNIFLGKPNNAFNKDVEALSKISNKLL